MYSDYSLALHLSPRLSFDFFILLVLILIFCGLFIIIFILFIYLFLFFFLRNTVHQKKIIAIVDTVTHILV